MGISYGCMRFGCFPDYTEKKNQTIAVVYDQILYIRAGGVCNGRTGITICDRTIQTKDHSAEDDAAGAFGHGT